MKGNKVGTTKSVCERTQTETHYGDRVDGLCAAAHASETDGGRQCMRAIYRAPATATKQTTIGCSSDNTPFISNLSFF